MSPVTLYGIANCDTVKKARTWLEAQGVAYRFHDFRADGLDAALVRVWIDTLGWETVINKRSTTWKQLSPEVRDGMDSAAAVSAALEAPTLIKRPVLTRDDATHIGFSADRYAEIFS
ncbi:MAG: ArsC family reductase [Pseudomonadota bacterium]